jgi:uncharacterized protein (TIGR00369 family)
LNRIGVKDDVETGGEIHAPANAAREDRHGYRNNRLVVPDDKQSRQARAAFASTGHLMNPDRMLALQFLASDRKPLEIASNPLAQELGGCLLELDESAGACTLSFQAPERFAQGAGVLQGGIVAAMLDFGMAFAAFHMVTADRSFATASMTLNLLKSAPPGRYLVRGRVVRLGARMIFTEATLHKSEADDLIATASGVMPLSPASGA